MSNARPKTKATTTTSIRSGETKPANRTNGLSASSSGLGMTNLSLQKKLNEANQHIEELKKEKQQDAKAQQEYKLSTDELTKQLEETRSLLLTLHRSNHVNEEKLNSTLPKETKNTIAPLLGTGFSLLTGAFFAANLTKWSVLATVAAAIPVLGWAALLAVSVVTAVYCASTYGRNSENNSLFFANRTSVANASAAELKADIAGAIAAPTRP